MRAMESERPAGDRVCHDPLARRFVKPFFYFLAKAFAGYGERKSPGTQAFLVARCRYIDDYLAVALNRGLEQLVVLGAGLDSRAYRFEGLKGGGVAVFEVDHPASQADKTARLRKVFGQLPGHVTFVPIDFNDEGLDKLHRFGYDRGKKTLFIWEGVTYYLTPEAVDGTLEFVRGTSGEGSSIIFDYVYASALTAARKRADIARMQRYSRFTGERLTFGIREGHLGEFLRRRGYDQVENVTADALRRLYFTGVNRDRPVAPVYAIAHASPDHT